MSEILFTLYVNLRHIHIVLHKYGYLKRILKWANWLRPIVNFFFFFTVCLLGASFKAYTLIYYLVLNSPCIIIINDLGLTEERCSELLWERLCRRAEQVKLRRLGDWRVGQQRTLPSGSRKWNEWMTWAKPNSRGWRGGPAVCEPQPHLQQALTGVGGGERTAV